MKICLIGDSHLAMMVAADKEFPVQGRHVSAVSWPRKLEDQVCICGNKLSAQSSELVTFWQGLGYSDTIRLDTFDCVIFVSYTVTPFNVFSILNEFIVTGWESARPKIKALKSQFNNPDRRRLLTRAALDACLVGIIQRNLSFKMISSLREGCDMPIVVVAAPFLAEDVLIHRPNLIRLNEILNADDGARFADCLNSAHRSAFSDIQDVSVVLQPEQSIVRGCLTRNAYRKGATRFGSDTAQRDDDILHAGPPLGKLIWEQIDRLGL